MLLGKQKMSRIVYYFHLHSLIFVHIIGMKYFSGYSAVFEMHYRRLINFYISSFPREIYCELNFFYLYSELITFRWTALKKGNKTVNWHWSGLDQNIKSGQYCSRAKIISRTLARDGARRIYKLMPRFPSIGNRVK